MDQAAKSMQGSRKIKIGNEAKILQGTKTDSYQSRYKAMKPEGTSRSNPGMKSKGGAVMRQIDKMTKGSY